MKSFLKELNELAEGPGKVYAKVQSKLKELGVEVSIGVIRDFFSKNDTAATKHLIKQLVNLGYDPLLGWVGNEAFFKDVGVSKDEFMQMMKSLGEMVYEATHTSETYEGITDLAEINGCPTKAKKKKEENEEEEHSSSNTIIKCPLCSRNVPEEDIDDHLEDHDSEEKQKRPVGKMKKTTDSTIVEAKKDATLNRRQKDELVDYVNDLITSHQLKDDKLSIEEAFYLALEDIAGFEHATKSTKQLLVRDLIKKLADARANKKE
jgi:hypothetical protein